MEKSRSLNNRKVSTTKGKMTRAGKRVTGKKPIVQGAATGRRSMARTGRSARVSREHAPTQRTTKEQANQGQDRVVVIYRNSADPAAAREEKRIQQKVWTKTNKALKAEGWYREDEPPTVQDIDPDTQITILRNNPDDPTGPRESKVITHGNYVKNLETYQADGWFRETDLHSASKPTDTVVANSHNTRTE